MNKPTFLDIDKVFFSSRDILYKNTSGVLLDVTDSNKSYFVNELHVIFIVFCKSSAFCLKDGLFWAFV